MDWCNRTKICYNTHTETHPGSPTDDVYKISLVIKEDSNAKWKGCFND
jgi:hypothetical protein